MKKDELTALGLTDEQADKVLAINGRDIEKHKKAAEDAKAETATLQQQLSDRDKDLETLKAGAEDLLPGLRSRGISMCIATATDKYLVEAALKRCEVRGFFSEIFTCSSVGSGKDRPQIYREAASHLGYEPREILVFEDALYAAKTAAADGFDLVGVYDSSERSQDELRNISNLFLEDFSESNRQKLYAYIDQKGESL